MEINVLLTRKFFDKDIDYLESKVSPDCNLIIPDQYDLDTLVSLADRANIFLGPVVSKKLCHAAPDLKFIQIPWTGVDNLDFALIEEIGVKICNSHSNAYSVAELAIGLMFDVAKKISYHDAEFRKGNWNRPRADKANIVSPFSKRVSFQSVGILGYGHVGRLIHKYLSGFDCQFHIIDDSFNENRKENDCYYYKRDYLSKLNTLDFLFICVPLTNNTIGFINENFINHLSNNVILINTSRGEIIDEKAVFNALKFKRIRGAGIDTWNIKPSTLDEAVFPSENYPFHNLNNIVLSSHRGGMIENELPHLEDAITNINRAVIGLEPLNVVSTLRQF